MTTRPNGALRGAIDAIGNAASPPRTYADLERLRPLVPRRRSRPSRATVFATAALLASAVAAVVVLRAGGEPDSASISHGPGVTSAVAPTTDVLPAPTQSIVYPAQQGDTVSTVAYLLCTTPESLAAANAWPDGTAHVLQRDERVAVPLGSCIQGDVLPGQSSAPEIGTVPVLGDIDAAGIAEALLSGGTSVTDLSASASGLARPDYFDWNSRVAEILPTLEDGTPVVVAIGAADAQSMVAADGAQIVPGTPEWSSEYMRRVEVFADAVLGAGHPLIWIVPSPPLPTNEWAQRMTQIADAIIYALENRPGAIYVNSWDVLRGPDGNAASETALDVTGAAVVVRADGAITPAGDQLLADRVWTALRLLGFDSERSVLPPATSSTSSSIPLDGGISAVEFEYTVQVGDYLVGIASRYQVLLDELVAYNSWPEGADHPLAPGDVIKIPPGFTIPGESPPQAATSAGGSYTVIDGDDLATIAMQSGTTVEALVQANGWADGASHTLVSGEVIKLP